MVARFPNMIALLYNTIKTGHTSCEVPINKLCLQTLRLLRDHSLIYGFQYVSPGDKNRRLYPRVRIMLKYSDINGPVITKMKPLKNTKSNFHIIPLKFINQENKHKKLIITTPQGLSLISFKEFYTLKAKKGKQLIEISF
jgi:ribosomal protein S8